MYCILMMIVIKNHIYWEESFCIIEIMRLPCYFIALILTLVNIHIDPSPATAGLPSWLLAVIGGVLGCVILIVIIAAACCIKRRKTSTIKRGKVGS